MRERGGGEGEKEGERERVRENAVTERAGEGGKKKRA